MSLMKNLFGRKDLATKRDRRSRLAAARRARRTPALDWLEDRRLLSVANLNITAITSASDTDGGSGGVEHVTVPAGATVTVNFSYTTAGVNVTTAKFDVNTSPTVVSVADTDSSLTTIGTESAGAHSHSLSLVIPAGTAPGTYNAHVQVKNGSGSGSTANETDSGSVVVSIPVTVASTTITGVGGAGSYSGNTVAVATLSASGGPLAGKTVTFALADNTLLGSAQTDASGVASLASTNAFGLNAGSYSIKTSFAGDSSNAASSGTGVLVINKADATIVPTGYNVVYDGQVHTATGSAAGVNGEDLGALLNLGGTAHTNAGTYIDSWSFAGNDNYNPASGAVTNVVNKADATIVVHGYNVTYDGQAHGLTGTVTGVGGVDLSGLLNLGATYTNAGSYSVGWSFAGDDNYNAASGTVSNVINKADATFAVTGYNVVYNGNSHTAAATATGVNGEDLGALLNLGGTAHTNAGSYTDSWSFAGNDNYNPASGSVTDVINKANATIAVTGCNVAYNGQAHGLTGTAAGVGGVDLSGLLNLGATYTNAGSYNVGWSFAGDQNYNAASGTSTVVITAVSLDDFTTATVQTALDLAKQGAVSFALSVGSNGIVDGKTIADLFNNAAFTLSMAGESATYSAQATVVDNVVYVNINLKNNLTFYNFLAQGLDSGETSASRADWECITLTASSNGGNYTISEDVLTRIFLTAKK